MTHDLFISVLECLSASIVNVLIDDLEQGIYYARLTLKSEKGKMRSTPAPQTAWPWPSGATLPSKSRRRWCWSRASARAMLKS